MSTKDDIDRITSELTALRDYVSNEFDAFGAKIDRIASTAARWQGGAILLAVIVGLVGFFAAAWLESHTRATVREELTNRRSFVQYGKFTIANMTQRSGALTFEWSLKTPVDPSSVVEMQAETAEPIPDVSIVASAIDDGRKCRMTILTNNNSVFVSKLADGIPAKVTVGYLSP